VKLKTINFLSKNKFKKILLTKNNQIIKHADKEKFDIILSPEFYWVRFFTIPFETKKNISKLLPALFEEFLDKDKEYEYYAIKDKDNTYVCFAYDSKNIALLLKKFEINSLDINAIYFAQNELKNYSYFKFHDSSFSYIDGLLVKIPEDISIKNEDEREVDLDKVKLSKHKINIKLYSNFLNQKYINIILILALILFFLNITKIFELNANVKSLEQKIIYEKQTSKLPQTMFQTKSILASLRRKISKQKKIRDKIELIFEYPNFSKINKITSLKYKQNYFELIISSNNKSDINDFKKYLKNARLKVKTDTNKKSYKLRFKI